MTPSPKSDRAYIIFAMRIMGEFTYMIAVPVVLFALAGKWLDARYGTAPKLLITGFALAVVISGISVWRRAKALGKEYQALSNQESGMRNQDTSNNEKTD